MIRVWGRRSSSNVQAVMWCIGELGLEHQRVDAGFSYGVVDTPAFLAMNPNGTVPVLEDDGIAPLWESAAILRYLAARYGDGGAFWPADVRARAEVDRWAEWAKVNVAAGFTGPVFWRVVRTAPAARDPAAIRAGVLALEARLAIAEAQIARAGWLAGSAFSLADILLGHMLYRYYEIDIERAALPALRGYYDRLCARPAFREHVMVSYDELRVS